VKGAAGRRRGSARRAWCSWHRGIADTARLIQITQAATGPGGMLWACQKCRTTYNLIPLAERTT
jgi:hypothetical protein